MLRLEDMEAKKTMTLDEALKAMEIQEGYTYPTDECGYWNFNIDFINNEGHLDQTQLDVMPYKFDAVRRKCKELNELWREFCKENGFKQNSITGISFAHKGF